VKLDDVVRNTPLVLKLVVNYNRQHQIHSTPDEIEFLDINLSKDTSFLLYAVHSPVYWRIFKKSYSSLVLWSTGGKRYNVNPSNM
jgi:hypothetical protein